MVARKWGWYVACLGLTVLLAMILGQVSLFRETR